MEKAMLSVIIKYIKGIETLLTAKGIEPTLAKAIELLEKQLSEMK